MPTLSRVSRPVGLYSGLALRDMLTAPHFFKVGCDAGPNVARARPRCAGKLKIMQDAGDVLAPLSMTMRMTQAVIDASKAFALPIMPVRHSDR